MNENRISMIPHDEFFKFLFTPNKNGNCPDFIRWSATYNEEDNKSPEATELFLKHEVNLSEFEPSY